jgi:copper chaperone CopZ
MFNFSKILTSPLKILCAAVVLSTASGLVTVATAAESAKATVNGMVCAFCAQGIEKRLSSLPATKAVFVDLRKKIVAVEAREGQSLDLAAIRHEITEAGYDVVKLETVAMSVEDLKAQTAASRPARK